MKFPSLTIAAKLYGLFALLAALTMALAAIALLQARRQAALADEYHSASVGAKNVERVNGLIYAVVMESRGIYMSPDIATAKKFGAGLMKFNEQISDVVKNWKHVVRTDDAAQFEQFAARIAQFQEFRRELVRRGSEISPAAGREYGDNDANRSVRSALNADIEVLAKLYDQRARQLAAKMDAENLKTDSSMSILGGISIAFAAVGALLIWREVVRPLSFITTATEAVAGGNNEHAIPYGNRRDEVGALARAVTIFRDAAVEKIRLESKSAEQRREAEVERQKNAAILASAAEELRNNAVNQAEAQAKIANEQRRNVETIAKLAEEQREIMQHLAAALVKISEGDLTVRLPDNFVGPYAQIKADFDTMAVRLHETMSAIAGSMRDVSSIAVEIATSTTDLTERTEQQAAGLEQTSASMEEISATVKKNAENAQHASSLASNSYAVADRGGAVVGNAVGAMSRIEQSSRKIADIIGVIDEIARQTNMLALNAAVEAARAGDAGRGFAVVAAEVRSLAQRSSQAAKDIKDLIANSSTQVKEGVVLVNQTGASLTEIVAAIKSVAEIVTEIASASAEQAVGIDQIGKALTSMDELTQQNSAFVEENAATAKSLEHQSRTMKERLAYFRLGDQDSQPERHAIRVQRAWTA